MAMRLGGEKGQGEGDEKELDLERVASIRLRGSKGSKGKVTFKGFRQIMKAIQDGKRLAGGAGRRKHTGSHSQMLASRPSKARASQQMVAVRMVYARNKGNGQWGAYGRYIERDSAMGRHGDERGFGEVIDPATGELARSDAIRTSKVLDQWQKAGDENLFKLIISPEFGDRLQLREYTHAYMDELQRRLGTKLQWVAADHYNTDDPHVHLAVRGVDDQGKPLIIPREFVRGPLRDIARDVATQRLGHRTSVDIATARERQVTQQRFTDLDRSLLKVATPGAQGQLVVDFSVPLAVTATEGQKELRLFQLRRLAQLERMGLVSRGTSGRWVMDGAIEGILRQRQVANDRLKTLHSNRAMVSDPRLPLVNAPTGDARIAGRVLTTGLDDATGKSYMLLESTRGSVIYLYQTPAMEKARVGGLKTGDFVVITQTAHTGDQGRTFVSHKVLSLGSAEAVLRDPKQMDAEARRAIRESSALPVASAWGGWQGEYHKALAQRATELVMKGHVAVDVTGKASVVEREKRPKGLAGELLGHGAAPYNFDVSAQPSYYVRLRDQSGGERVVWGSGLRTAVAKSGATVGDQVALINRGRTKETIVMPKRDASGRITGQVERQVLRTAWDMDVQTRGRRDQGKTL